MTGKTAPVPESGLPQVQQRALFRVAIVGLPFAPLLWWLSGKLAHAYTDWLAEAGDPGRLASYLWWLACESWTVLFAASSALVALYWPPRRLPRALRVLLPGFLLVGIGISIVSAIIVARIAAKARM